MYIESTEEEFVAEIIDVARGSEGNDDAKVVSGRRMRVRIESRK